MRKSVLATSVLALGLVSGAGAGRADEILTAIQEAQKAYEAGDAGTARTALEEALQLLAQRAASGLAAALPAPLPGWTADEAQSTAAAAGFAGLGVQASRSYRNRQDQQVDIRITADSPMIAQIAMVLNNPAMAGAMGRLIRVNQQRAVQTSDGEIQMLVGNRFLVTVSGDAPNELKMAYARAVDLSRLSGRN